MFVSQAVQYWKTPTDYLSKTLITTNHHHNLTIHPDLLTSISSWTRRWIKLKLTTFLSFIAGRCGSESLVGHSSRAKSLLKCAFEFFMTKLRYLIKYNYLTTACRSGRCLSLLFVVECNRYTGTQGTSLIQDDLQIQVPWHKGCFMVYPPKTTFLRRVLKHFPNSKKRDKLIFPKVKFKDVTWSIHLIPH
jgi:hypothetical protein